MNPTPRNFGTGEAAEDDETAASTAGSGIDPMVNESHVSTGHGTGFSIFGIHLSGDKESISGETCSPPKLGETFLGFHLIRRLGTGAFAEVYLAAQSELADRPVVLKVADEIGAESQTLARLQHTNIVPVLSIHRSPPYQAVCMPYFGSTTLQDLLDRRKNLPSRSGSDPLPPTFSQFFPPTTPNTPESKNSQEQSPSEPQLASSFSAFDSRAGETGYSSAVAWLIARIADGLAHAHERGIVHMDLKPANVLLTDDGQPMILDFNLSQDKSRAVDRGVTGIGGTLPYMAPEHLESMLLQRIGMDHRADIYSLGVIFFELLVGKLPFKIKSGKRSLLEQMVQERRQFTPSVRSKDPRISVAIDAIVRKCLEPDPDKRYQNAKQVAEDLDRHLGNLPLRHAREPWGRERFAKWIANHPGLTSGSTVAGVAGIALLMLVMLLAVRSSRLATFEANEQLQQFRGELQTVRYLLNAPNLDQQKYLVGRELAEKNLRRFGVGATSDWMTSPTVETLSQLDRKKLSEEVGELLYLQVRQDLRQITAESKVDSTRLSKLRRENALAIRSYGPLVPQALHRQQQEILQLLGQELPRPDSVTASDPAAHPDDLYFSASENLGKGMVSQAEKLLEDVVQQRPDHFWAWIALGHCHDSQQRMAQAELCFSTAIALGSEYPWPYFLRGVVRLKLKKYRSSLADFDHHLELVPDSWETFVNRALAYQGLNDLGQAEADLTRALELGAPLTRVLFMRSRVRQLAGDNQAAEIDRQRGLRAVPVDEVGWVARGMARIKEEPKAALADFEEALRLNPSFRPALQNKAHVLAEILGKPREAARVLDRLLQLYPEFLPARGGRGVLLARLGERDAAHRDAEYCLGSSNQPETCYQVACIYALTSTVEKQDALQAIILLRSAIGRGWGLDFLKNDPDLNPIRHHPDFLQLASAANQLRTNATSVEMKNKTKDGN